MQENLISITLTGKNISELKKELKKLLAEMEGTVTQATPEASPGREKVDVNYNLNIPLRTKLRQAVNFNEETKRIKEETFAEFGVTQFSKMRPEQKDMFMQRLREAGADI